MCAAALLRVHLRFVRPGRPCQSVRRIVRGNRHELHRKSVLSTDKYHGAPYRCINQAVKLRGGFLK
jgi:hypothetical protein